MAQPEVSHGARLERDAIRDYLRRKIKAELRRPAWKDTRPYRTVLKWVLARQRRYKPRAGGL